MAKSDSSSSGCALTNATLLGLIGVAVTAVATVVAALIGILPQVLPGAEPTVTQVTFATSTSEPPSDVTRATVTPTSLPTSAPIIVTPAPSSAPPVTAIPTSSSTPSPPTVTASPAPDPVTVTPSMTPSVTPSATPSVPSGAVAYYTFDGDAHDKSGNDIDANVQGATFTTGRDGRVSALQFDGINDSVQLPNESAFDLTTFTIIVWLKFDGPRAADDWIISKGPRFGNFSLRRNSSSAASRANHASYAHVTQSGNYSAPASDGPLPVGQFFCLAISLDNTSFRSYVNGQLAQAIGNVSPPSPNDDPVYVGAGGYDTVNAYFSGVIDEVQIYGRVLNATEIMQQCQ